ncbi:MAG: nucleotidyltransferase substrate binding protein [Rhodospirillales bacterium]|nr:nucleotidyltransferase substrate binding protein [Rhodospirillales bacterium]
MSGDKPETPPTVRLQAHAAIRGLGDRPSILPLQRAIERLEEGLERYRTDTSDTQIRDGLVQRFEFTYELGHKILKRYLEYASANPEQFDEMKFQDLIRTANEQGLLLGDWTNWRGFREMRARTSHTYNEDVAVEVVEGIPRFVEEVVYLRDQLRRRLA